MIYLQESSSMQPIILEEPGPDGHTIKTIVKPEEFGASGKSLPTEQSSSPISEMDINYGGSEISEIDETPEKIKSDVINALERSGYYWRAIESVATELCISEDITKAVLRDLIKSRQVVVAPRRDAQGRSLFTTSVASNM
jgi:hypothetical protein